MKYLILIFLFSSCYTYDKATGDKWRYGAVTKKDGMYTQYRMNKQGVKQVRTCPYKWSKFQTLRK